jgi:ribonuclease J
MIDELDRAGALREALAVWSMWRGYMEQPSERRMLERLRERGVPLEFHHVSGHAYLPDLQRLADAIAPDRVVPIHTERPDRYEDVFAAIERHADGEWWEV